MQTFNVPSDAVPVWAVQMSGRERTVTPEALCRDYAERVYRFAIMVARGSVEAEDLAQDALERAIRKIHQFDPRRGTVEAWLWRIVVNAARDTGRLGSRRQALWERLVGQQPFDATDATDVESTALGRLSDSELIAHLRRLPARDRALIALRFGADLDHASVAAALGMSAGAATTAIRRALVRLRKQLEAQP